MGLDRYSDLASTALKQDVDLFTGVGCKLIRGPCIRKFKATGANELKCFDAAFASDFCVVTIHDVSPLVVVCLCEQSKVEEKL